MKTTLNFDDRLVRVVTHPRLFDPPHSAEEACEALARLLASPSVTVLVPGTGYAVSPDS